jgi:hypothetical protein
MMNRRIPFAALPAQTLMDIFVDGDVKANRHFSIQYSLPPSNAEHVRGATSSLRHDTHV